MIQQPESWTYRAHNPDWRWDVHAYLLASIADSENLSLWQRGGGKGRKPAPVPRPRDKTTEKTGVAIQQLDAILGRDRIGTEN